MTATRILDVLACALAVFAAAPLRAQHYQDLYDFDCATGCMPSGQLTQGTNGNLYGTTASGGLNNLGTLFMVTTAGVYTPLLNSATSKSAFTVN